MKDETRRDEAGGAGKCPFGFGGGAQPHPAQPLKAPEAGRVSGLAPEAAGYRHLPLTTETADSRLPGILDAPVPESTDGLASGRCLCGKVSFRALQQVSMVFASHDAISRRRAGGVAMTVMLRAASTAFAGWNELAEYQVSPREVSCFCRNCGTPVLTRYLAPDAMAGMISISVGLLDCTEGLRLAADISHDEKPAFYAFAGERRAVSSAELEAMFAGRGR